ncbi:hypothetical protein Dsin_023085 [Dipteronia sinensis]|uniref:Cytochrome P450 n=1 Tax=Dipteronia sinensis TaxID=43782 RepID=A0AAE0A3A0_9ROSI|nr:hypothetical protein Dsin_023085 [Dipteronia sinensis]
MKANTAEKWIEQRIRKYGPISKLSLFGKPTVFVYGPAANKFVFNGDSSTIANQQPKSIRMILGDRCLVELSGQDHKRVRDALVSFLKPESLKKYLETIDGEIREHLKLHWHGKEHVTVLPLMKTLTFNIICSLLFGLRRGAERDQFVSNFETMLAGMWSVPVNLPFTRYNGSLKASAIVQNMLKDLIQEKKKKLEYKTASPHQDLITCLLSIRDENGQEVITEKEIVHNVMLVMVAGHDTSSVLITFLIRLLAKDPAVYAAVLQEQEEIAKGKSMGEFLTWEDLTKMKYTWRVAMETLRMIPPVFGGFRKTLKASNSNSFLSIIAWLSLADVLLIHFQIFWDTNMTHMDDSIFPEPSKFDHSRFENQSSIPPYCYLPFGAGYRICPGYEFARIETLLVIHRLVTQFTWKLQCSDNAFSRDPIPVPTKGLPIQIVPKNLQ